MVAWKPLYLNKIALPYVGIWDIYVTNCENAIPLLGFVTYVSHSKKGSKRGQIHNFSKNHHLKLKFGSDAQLYNRNSTVTFISAKSHFLTHFWAPQGSNGGQNGQKLPVCLKQIIRGQNFQRVSFFVLEIRWNYIFLLNSISWPISGHPRGQKRGSK